MLFYYMFSTWGICLITIVGLVLISYFYNNINDKGVKV